jgi:PST family polysaccharide transporter
MKWGIFSSLVKIAAILVGLPFGAKGVAIAFVVATWLMAFPAIRYAGRPLGIGAVLVTRAVGRRLLGAITTAAAGWWLQTAILIHFQLLPVFLSAGFCISIYLLVVVGLLRLTQPIKVAGGLVQDHLHGEHSA